jgi:hypothetical protein
LLAEAGGAARDRWLVGVLCRVGVILLVVPLRFRCGVLGLERQAKVRHVNRVVLKA